MSRVRMPSSFLTRPWSRTVLGGRELRGVRHLERRRDALDRRTPAGSTAPHSDSTEERLDCARERPGERRRLVGLDDGPAADRWSRPGSTGVSRRLASHCVPATTRSGSSTIRPGGSAASGASRGNASAPVPSRTGLIAAFSPPARTRDRSRRGARPGSCGARAAVRAGPSRASASRAPRRPQSARTRVDAARPSAVIRPPAPAGAAAPPGGRRCGPPLPRGRTRSSATR